MSLTISRILHAGYVLECAGTRIAFDTIFENPFSKNCYAFPSINFDLAKIKQEKFAAVFISHFHDDHCSLESLNLLDRETPIYIYCLYEELIAWIKELGFKKVQALDLNIPVKVGSFEVIPRRALDADVDCLYQVKAAGLNLLNVVDSWIDHDTMDLLVKQGPWDMILWPFQTMRELEVISPLRAEVASTEIPPEWQEQIRKLNPRYIVPSSCQFKQESWSWYNNAFFPITYTGFANQIKSILPNTQTVRMNPGTSFKLSENEIRAADPLPWIIPTADQNLDYEYIANLKPPSTGEVATHFPALTDEQKERVLQYCHGELMDKYKSMAGSEDSYFAKQRHWKLILWNQEGTSEELFYEIQGDDIKAAAPIAKFQWLTELPSFKLWNTLENGETLTSLYMRINDVSFDGETEKELQEVDISEDPLIRCLFNGVFCAYQKAQLDKLKTTKDLGR